MNFNAIYLQSLIRRCFSLACLILLFVQCSEKSSEEPENQQSSVVEITPGSGMDLYGFIGDEGGNPVPNVVVSDGFTCTTTDSKGIYQMKKNGAAKFVFYSTPSDYAVNTKSQSVKMALFYSAITGGKRYDFQLKKLSAVETNFNLLCIGDPQVASDADVNRFNTETMADIKSFVQSSTTPCYALTTGDMTGVKPALNEQMKILAGSASMPVFATIGNHDKLATSNASEPCTATTYSIVFGPLNYSFNRGNVHFVCLDDIVYSNSTTYSGGFSASQIAWLKQDLSYVSKDKMVIVYYHIPIRNSSSVTNSSQIINALQGFAEVHLMCGHTHYAQNYIYTSPISAYEHIHAAACGAWWKSTINGDGTPNGYAVYTIKGNTISNWYYKATKLSKDFQIRLYKGDASFGGTYGSYSFGQAINTIVANVWNADSSWKVEAYENGVKVADLKALPVSMNDAWALGYHLGVLNRDPDNYTTACKHLYLHTMVNPSASLEIRATDRFGSVYSQKEITSDLTTAISY